MCLEFDLLLCFGLGKRKQDYGRSSASRGATTTPHLHAKTPHDQRNNGHYLPHQHITNGQRHHHQLPVADEEYRKASNDARRGHHAHAAATKDVHGYAVAGGAQETTYAYSAADGTLSKHPATNAMVSADGAQYHYYQDRQPAHRQQYYHGH